MANNVEAILKLAGSNPHPPNQLFRHESQRIIKHDKSGNIFLLQASTPCFSAVINFYVTTGRIVICGQRPWVALPYLEGWTRACVEPPRSKRTGRGRGQCS